MTTPRRYRIALRAFPRAARERHRDDVLSTLSDADDRRGGASWAEAWQLLTAGISLRVRCLADVLTSGRLLSCAAALALLVAVAPASTWVQRTGLPGQPHGYFVRDGPTPVLRWALIAIGASALVVALHGRRPVPVLGALGFGLVGFAASVAEALHRPGAHPLSLTEIRQCLLAGAALTLVVLATSRMSGRISHSRRVQFAAGLLMICGVMALVAALHADAPSDLATLRLWQLRPAGLVATATVLLAGLALASSHRVGSSMPASD